ncbi:hypothetical protein ACOMHN_046752 [Nucella lapillus]
MGCSTDQYRIAVGKFVDGNTGNGVYCEPNCCGSNPTYCCNKDQFIIESAVFGSLGILFIVCMIVCCVCKKRKRDQKKAALKGATATKAKTAPASKPASIAVVSSASNMGGGGGGGGVVNQGFCANEPTVGDPSNKTVPPLPGSQNSDSKNQDLSLREIDPSTSPASPPPSNDNKETEANLPPPGDKPPPPGSTMYSEDRYPPPATPSLPQVTYVSESPQPHREPLRVDES